MRYLIASIAILTLCFSAFASDSDKQAVSETLDAYHTAASKADWETYFGLMSDDAIFLGTDASERWDKETFQSYATPTKAGHIPSPSATSISRLMETVPGLTSCSAIRNTGQAGVPAC